MGRGRAALTGALVLTALLGGAGAKTKDKWGIFKSIDEARTDGAADAAPWGGAAPGACASGHDELKDEIALLKGKLASAESVAVEAQRKLEDSRKQTAQLQQQRHSLLQERKAAEEEAASMKLQLREARDALAASHRATKDAMIDYLRALRDAEARTIPAQAPTSPPSPSRAAAAEGAGSLREAGTRKGSSTEQQPLHQTSLRGSDSGAGKQHSDTRERPGADRRDAEEQEEEEEEGAEEAGAEVEVVGSEGVLKIRGRKLVLQKGGVEEDVLLRDVQTVTSSAQGTIKVLGRRGVELLAGPPLASFPAHELGAFFETVKAQVSAAKRAARRYPSAASSPPPASRQSSPADAPLPPAAASQAWNV